MRACKDNPKGEITHMTGTTKSPRCPWHRKQWADHKRDLRDAKDAAAKEKIKYRPTPRPAEAVNSVLKPSERVALQTVLLELTQHSGQAQDALTLLEKDKPGTRRQPGHAQADQLAATAKKLANLLTPVLTRDPLLPP